jgi:tellurite resistance protein
MAMTASDTAARVRPGKPNTFDATVMMVAVLAQKRDSREVKQLVGYLALVRSDDRLGICTDQSICVSSLLLEV